MKRNSHYLKGHYKILNRGMQSIIYSFTHGHTPLKYLKNVHHFSVPLSLLPACACLHFSYRNLSLGPYRLLVAP